MMKFVDKIHPTDNRQQEAYILLIPASDIFERLIASPRTFPLNFELAVTDFSAYNDTFGTWEKCHCKQVSA